MIGCREVDLYLLGIQLDISEFTSMTRLVLQHSITPKAAYDLAACDMTDLCVEKSLDIFGKLHSLGLQPTTRSLYLEAFLAGFGL